MVSRETHSQSRTSGRSRVRGTCRACMVSCGVFFEIEAGRVVRIQGDKDDPASHGYTCKRGRDMPRQLHSSNRLRRPLRRGADGALEPTDGKTAVREIAARLGALVEAHGPASVALYNGTYALAPPASMIAPAFMSALGSPMTFSCGSIDQPGKFLARALHGQWLGGGPPFNEAETWLFVGTNPAVSGLGGVPTVNPNYYLHRAVKRGIQLVVIDPRRSETARKARVHLQPRPGEDPAVLAGMIRIVLEESLHDADFVAAHSRGLEALRQAVEPFTPELVAARADVPAEKLREAARVFASARTGGANAGTGPNMSPRGVLSEYLLACLVTLCGFRARAGDRDPNPGVLVPRGPRRAQAQGPMPAWGYPPKLRVRGLSNTACGLPTGALADEILLEGEGQIRALFCLGGNPMQAWPDQDKTRAALEKLDLLVVLDPRLTQTARFAHYVVPPKLPPEIPALTYDFEELESHSAGWGYPLPYAAYREALVEPPPGSDLMEDWELFYDLARELGLALQPYLGILRLPGDPPGRFVALDMERKPSTDELFDELCRGSRIPLDEVRRHHEGRVYDDPDCVVQPPDPDCGDRLELADPVMLEQLGEAALRSGVAGDEAFPFRLVNRRLPNTLNSLGREQPYLVRERPHHPAYMHPDDLAALGLELGTVVAITSKVATVFAVVLASDDLRRGLVSMSHGYGLDLEQLGPDDDPGEPQPGSLGRHTGALASAERDYQEDYSGLPRMSTIPVRVASAGHPTRARV